NLPVGKGPSARIGLLPNWFSFQNRRGYPDEHLVIAALASARPWGWRSPRSFAPGHAAKNFALEIVFGCPPPRRALLSPICHHEHLQCQMRFLRVRGGSIRSPEAAQREPGGSA